MRATIDWSAALLEEHERSLFARFSVFAGGATVVAVERVCADPGGPDVLESLAGLVDKSMLVHDDDARARLRRHRGCSAGARGRDAVRNRLGTPAWTAYHKVVEPRLTDARLTPDVLQQQWEAGRQLDPFSLLDETLTALSSSGAGRRLVA